MRKYIIILLMLLISLGQASAQSQETIRPYRIGASLGHSFTGYREETYSQVNRYLNTLTFMIDGNIEKSNFLHSLNIVFFMGKAAMAASEQAVLSKALDQTTGETYYFVVLRQYLYIRGYIEYSLARRLWGNEVFPGYLGGAFRADTYMQFTHYPSITGLFSLNLHASQKWNINSANSLILSVSFPILGYAVRPAFAGADHAMIQYASENPLRIITLGEITSLHNH